MPVFVNRVGQGCAAGLSPGESMRVSATLAAPVNNPVLLDVAKGLFPIPVPAGIIPEAAWGLSPRRWNSRF